MKVLIINSVCGIRSTGRICTELADRFAEQGNEVKIAYGRMDEVPEKYQKYAVRIGTKWDCTLHMLRTRMWDQHGFGSVRATKKFLEWVGEYQPDLIWLHNIHGYYINAEMLFDWIKRHPDVQVKWTLHDCWAFTGHCSYFTAIQCEQWKTHCENCPQLRRYPACYGRGNAYRNYERKRAAFTGVRHMELITPSQWLADLVKQSFLKEYPIMIHYNTINTDVFKPTPGNFREKYGLQNKFIVLGVASIWDERKGLQDFYRLAQMLDERFAIVLVGLSKKQVAAIPHKLKGMVRRKTVQDGKVTIYSPQNEREDSNLLPDVRLWEQARKESSVVPRDIRAMYREIVGDTGTDEAELLRCRCVIAGITRTNNAKELAEIYTVADIFANPTYEDNYPTVNLEARACGTRVVTYDTGGCRETLRNSD